MNVTSVRTLEHRPRHRSRRHSAFRDDLRYRLRRGVLRVPPLRDRREDIPLLVEHFRREINRRWRLAIEGITPEAMARLQEHLWPGNVRELQAVLEQALIFQDGGWTRPEHLELDTEEDDKRPVATMDLHPPKAEDDRPRDRFDERQPSGLPASEAP